MRIRKCTQAFEWCHFQWPWTKISRLRHYLTLNISEIRNDTRYRQLQWTTVIGTYTLLKFVISKLESLSEIFNDTKHRAVSATAEFLVMIMCYGFYVWLWYSIHVGVFLHVWPWILYFFITVAQLQNCPRLTFCRAMLYKRGFSHYAMCVCVSATFVKTNELIFKKIFHHRVTKPF